MIRDENPQWIIEGPNGTLTIPPHDEITPKLLMLMEGECEDSGPLAAARKYGYSKQRYYQLLHLFLEQGAVALKNGKRGPRTKSRRTDAVVRQVIRHRFLDPDASAEVIAQKLEQAGWPISIRSVERILTEYGLQKKTVYVSSRRPRAAD